MKDTITSRDGRAPPGRKKPPPCAKSRSPTKLSVLPFQRLEPLTLFALHPRPKTRIALRPAYPLAQRLRRTAKLRRHRYHRCPLRIVPRLMLQHHAHRSLPNLRGVSRQLVHDPILSKSRASGKPGTVQMALTFHLCDRASPERDHSLNCLYRLPDRLVNEGYRPHRASSTQSHRLRKRKSIAAMSTVRWPDADRTADAKHAPP